MAPRAKGFQISRGKDGICQRNRKKAVQCQPDCLRHLSHKANPWYPSLCSEATCPGSSCCLHIPCVNCRCLQPRDLPAPLPRGLLPCALHSGSSHTRHGWRTSDVSSLLNTYRRTAETLTKAPHALSSTPCPLLFSKCVFFDKMNFQT